MHCWHARNGAVYNLLSSSAAEPTYVVLQECKWKFSNVYKVLAVINSYKWHNFTRIQTCMLRPKRKTQIQWQWQHKEDISLGGRSEEAKITNPFGWGAIIYQSRLYFIIWLPHHQFVSDDASFWVDPGESSHFQNPLRTTGSCSRGTPNCN